MDYLEGHPTTTEYLILDLKNRSGELGFDRIVEITNGMGRRFVGLKWCV